MSSIPRWVLAAGVVLLLALIGWAGWTFYLVPKIQRIAFLERDRAVLDSTLRARETTYRERVARDTVLADSIGVLLRHARRPVSHPGSDSAAILADSLEVLARKNYTDSVAVAAALDAKDALLFQKDLEHAADVANLQADIVGVNRLWETRMVSKDSTVAELRTDLANAIDQRERYRKESHPNLFGWILRELPVIAAAGGAGVLVGVAVF